MQTTTSVRVVAGLRAAFGLALTVGTLPLLRLMVRREHSGDLVQFARTVGIRDLVLGTGCLLASLDPAETRDLRRWVAVALVSDVADVVAGATASRYVGRSGGVAAAVVPLPFVAAGISTLRRLRQG